MNLQQDALVDALLVARVQAGDDSSAEQIVRRHVGPMLATARRLLGDQEAATHAVREAFRRWLALPAQSLRMPCLAAALRQQTIAAALDALRARPRHVAPMADLLPAFTADGHHRYPVWPWRQTSAELLCGGRATARFRSLVDRLPDRHRAALLLCDVESLGVAEAAELLGERDAVVRRNLHEARMALRELCERELVDPVWDAAAFGF